MKKVIAILTTIAVIGAVIGGCTPAEETPSDSGSGSTATTPTDGGGAGGAEAL